MSELCRFQTKNPETGEMEWLKTLIFERSSKRLHCMVCDQKRFGVLFRGVQPKDGDTLICYECASLISKGRSIRVADDQAFGFYDVDPTEPVECPICHKMYKPGKSIIGHMNKMHPGADQRVLGDLRGKRGGSRDKQKAAEKAASDEEQQSDTQSDVQVDGAVPQVSPDETPSDETEPVVTEQESATEGNDDGQEGDGQEADAGTDK